MDKINIKNMKASEWKKFRKALEENLRKYRWQ